jgi:allophanate hydrolase
MTIERLLASYRDGAEDIEVEIWELATEAFGRFVAAVPWPLAIGAVTLADGRHVKGFICEADAIAGAREITAHGGWRAYRAVRRAGAAAGRP